jgi:acyl-CoA thioesterase-2
MNESLRQVIEQVRLERLDDNLFRGRGTWGPGFRLYGGEVMAQALSAAQQTVEAPLVLHSMHAYFLRPGDPARPVIYDVENLRDGRSFSSRRVTARQHGHAIYSCQTSYQRPEEGLTHAHPMPQVPGPDGLVSEGQRLAKLLPLEFQHVAHSPIESRQVMPQELKAEPAPMEPRNYVWMRAPDRLPDDLALHQQLLAFVSDAHLLATAIRPHGLHPIPPKMLMTSLDHTMWYHRPFRIDEWLLFELYSPFAGNGRGLAMGYIYSADGELVATAAQEGLMRLGRE